MLPFTLQEFPTLQMEMSNVGGLRATRSLSVEVPGIWVYILLFFNLYSSSYVTNLNYFLSSLC